MKKILAFGASNSSQSINQKFAVFAAEQLKGVSVTTLNLQDYEMPIYGIDKEKATGIPELAQQFSDLIAEQDGLIISLAEHNGNFTSAFKNLIDWVSRLPVKVWQNKLLFLLSTSPGQRGGVNAMNLAVKGFPFMDGKVVAHFCLPGFRQNFDEQQGIVAPDLKANFEEQLQGFQIALQQPVQS